VLREIVAPTQYLDVRGVFRGTSLRVRDDVVEVKARGRSTRGIRTTPLIALPYFELHPAWNKPIVFQREGSDGWTIALLGARELKLELKNLAASRLLSPAIN
jgi:hypothetical protein